MHEFIVFMKDATGVWQGQAVMATDRAHAVRLRTGSLAIPLVTHTEIWTTGKDERNCVTLVKHLVRQIVSIEETIITTADEEECC